jgi:hypothetical protein
MTTLDDIAYVRDYIDSRKTSDPHWRGEALNALSRVAAEVERLRAGDAEGPVAERCACRRTCMKQDGCRIR